MGARTFSSHPSLKVRILGVLVDGVKEVSCKWTVERNPVHGTRRKPLGHTKGKATFEFSITFYREHWEKKVKPTLAAIDPNWADAGGTVSIFTLEPGQVSSNVEAYLEGWNDGERTSADGSDAHEVKLTGACYDLLEDGRSVIEEDAA